jgi:alpha-mannosidase
VTERTNIAAGLDQILKEEANNPLGVAGYCYGIGNHGGGPTRALLQQIANWGRAHPEVTLVFSGLHRFFEAIRSAIRALGLELPVRRGELGFCLRGCYASMARFKFAYRKAEARLIRAERTSSVINESLEREGENLDEAWEALLFNSFHDILPGSSIERAMREQQSWLGLIDYASQKAELDLLTSLAAEIDTTVPAVAGDYPTAVPLLLWNPHPHAYRGHVEIETCLDYRPLWTYQDKPASVPVRVRDASGISLPYQEIPTEHTFMLQVPWRKRLIVPVEIPAMGWNVLDYGWVEGAENSATKSELKADESGMIANEFYRLEAKAGQSGMRLWQEGVPVFGEPGMSVAVFDDPWGSWGGLSEEAESLDSSTEVEKWTISQTKVLETGPERVALWVRFAGARSHLDLTFHLCRGRKALDVKARVFWNERRSRLKLQFPCGDRATFEVPGGTAERTPGGEVPGGRWVRVTQGDRSLGFASDALYNFDLKDGVFRTTVLRSSGYATEGKSPGWDEPWRPVGDGGEHLFQFLLQAGNDDLPQLAAELELPPVIQQVPASPGKLLRQGSLMTLEPGHVQILSLKRETKTGDVILRAQARVDCQPVLTWLGQRLDLGSMPAEKIVSWTISKKKTGWEVRPGTPL